MFSWKVYAWELIKDHSYSGKIYVHELQSRQCPAGHINVIFSWKRNHGIHADSHRSEEKNMHLTKLCSNAVSPPICCCARGALHTRCRGPRMSMRTPPTRPHHYKTDHNLLSSPAPVHLEPVCASPGCSCPTQRDQELQEGRDDDEEEHNSEGRGKTAADLKLPTTAQTVLHYK